MKLEDGSFVLYDAHKKDFGQVLKIGKRAKDWDFYVPNLGLGKADGRQIVLLTDDRLNTLETPKHLGNITTYSNQQFAVRDSTALSMEVFFHSFSREDVAMRFQRTFSAIATLLAVLLARPAVAANISDFVNYSYSDSSTFRACRVCFMFRLNMPATRRHCGR